MGLVNRLDIPRSAEYHHGGAEERCAPRNGATLADLADPNAPAVGPWPRWRACWPRWSESRQRVVVVDDERRPIGIISDGDLLRRSHSGRAAGRRPSARHRDRATAGAPPDPTETAADSRPCCSSPVRMMPRSQRSEADHRPNLGRSSTATGRLVGRFTSHAGLAAGQRVTR